MTPVDILYKCIATFELSRLCVTVQVQTPPDVVNDVLLAEYFLLDNNVASFNGVIALVSSVPVLVSACVAISIIPAALSLAAPSVPEC